MKKSTQLSLLLALCLIAGCSYYLTSIKISEKRYNKVMCYYSARSVTDGARNFKEKIIRLRDFVNENTASISDYYNRLDTCAIEKLITGIAWCDQQARVFMQLARSMGITTRLLFLRNKEGFSPHSVAEALTPDGRWIIVDPAYKLDLIRKDGFCAGQADIKENPNIISRNKRVCLRAKYESRWAEADYLSIYSNPPRYVITKNGVEYDFLKFIPRVILRPIVRIINTKYLKQIKPKMASPYEFEFIKARTLHLLEYYTESAALYDDIISGSSDILLKDKAEFYKAVLLKDQKKYKEAFEHIDGIILRGEDNPYYGYLLGLRARILEKVGRPLEAEENLKSAEYNLEI